MDSKLNLIKQIEQIFREVLDVTGVISKNLEHIQSVDDLELVAAGLRKRDELIRTINGLEEQSALLKEEASESEAYEKYRWLCREIAQKIGQADQKNLAAMNEALKRFMDNVRTSRESLRVISAYAAQNAEEQL